MPVARVAVVPMRGTALGHEGQTGAQSGQYERYVFALAWLPQWTLEEFCPEVHVVGKAAGVAGARGRGPRGVPGAASPTCG